MSVTQITKELETMQSAFENFKTEYAEQFKHVCRLENTFMNAVEDLDSYFSEETTKLLNILSKYTEFVTTFRHEYDTNKFEEGNFNRVSIIKKQDDTIKTLEIKIAELEMRLASAEKNQARSSVKNVEEPIPAQEQIKSVEHQCYARVGKAKYNISKQAPDFMTDFPEGTFITKTGCVVGLSCANTVSYTNVLFCPEHNTGKFEDIRTEPGTPQAPITNVHEPPHVEPQQVEKKKTTTRKKKEVVTASEPVVTASEPVVTVSEPVVTVSEPVVTASEPVVTASEPVVTVSEPVVTVSEPVVTVSEPVIVNVIPTLNLTFEQEDILDNQSPPLSPVVDISTINQHLTLENIKEHHDPVQESVVLIEPPSFDDIEFYDDPMNGKTYYLDSKTKRIYEIAPNDEIGVFVKQL